jgi:hypothetical protein
MSATIPIDHEPVTDGGAKVLRKFLHSVFRLAESAAAENG